MHLVDPGQRVVLIADVYGGVYRMTSQVYEPKGYRFTYVPAEEFDEGLGGYLDDDVRLVWVETPSNPLLNVVDIRRAADAAHAAGALLVVDNTFASPYLQQPLELGADLVLHSTTKYLGGHSDVIGGFVATNDPALGERLRFLQKSLGAVPGPFDAWLVLRGIKTLALRMRQHCENAREIAAFLDGHPAVERVLYPGLAAHPGHEVARRQMRDFGGMISFLVETEEEAVALAGRTKLFALAESLGGVESLIEHPARMTHASTADAPFAAPRNLRPPLGRNRGRRRPDRRPRDRARAVARPRRGLAACSIRSTSRFLGLERGIAVYVVETADGPALFDCGPVGDAPSPARGAGRARPRPRRHPPPAPLAHPLRPRGRGRPDRARAPRPDRLGLRGRRPHLIDPSRLEASARRLYGDSFDTLWGELAPVPERSIRLADGDVLGWDAFPTVGHASHHVCYLRDGTLLAGDACGVRPQPARYIVPPTPPPDIDLEAWHRSIATIRGRGPERLALTHFGVECDGRRPPRPPRGRARPCGRRSYATGWAGRSSPPPGRPRSETIASSAAGVAGFDQSWQGLRRYWDKRAERDRSAVA